MPSRPLRSCLSGCTTPATSRPRNLTRNAAIRTSHWLSARQVAMILAGGRIPVYRTGTLARHEPGPTAAFHTAVLCDANLPRLYDCSTPFGRVMLPRGGVRQVDEAPH